MQLVTPDYASTQHLVKVDNADGSVKTALLQVLFLGKDDFSRSNLYWETYRFKYYFPKV
jgi:hypothetical protein